MPLPLTLILALALALTLTPALSKYNLLPSKYDCYQSSSTYLLRPGELLELQEMMAMQR